MDYCTFALESLLEDQKTQQLMEVNHLVEESNFIYECVSSGYISLENLEYTPVTEGLADSLTEFFNKLLLKFKEAAVKRANKYVPWVTETRNEIKERAGKIEPKSLSPLWKGQWRKDGTEIVRAIRTAITNFNNGKFDDYSFTKAFLAKPEILTDSGTYSLTEDLKLYFRYGEVRSERPDNVNVTGGEMVKLIDDMFEYVINFNNIVVKSLENNNKNMATELKKLKVSNNTKVEPTTTGTKPEEGQTPDTNSISADTWLSIEQRPISESGLNILANYVALFEDTNDADQQKAKQQDQKTREEVAQQNEEQGSVTASQDANKKPEGQGEEKSENKPDDKSTEYINNVNRFARLAMAAYQTALDERYLLYINIFKDIGDASGGGPKFKDGKYVSKKNKAANDTTKVASAKESFIPVKSSKVLGKLK